MTAASIHATLRRYQRRDIKSLRVAWKRARRVLYAAATGSGKTMVFARIVADCVEAGERCLILVHRREILEQTWNKLIDDGLDPTQIGLIFRDDPRTDPRAPVQLASIDTLVRRNFPRNIRRIFIDEAHHAVSKKFETVLRHYPLARVMGVTATPVRLDGKPLGDAFDVLVVGEPVEKLIEGGWLAKPEVWTKPGWKKPDLRGLNVSRSTGDYVPKALGERMSRRKIVGDIVGHWKEHANGRPTVAFAASVKHAESIRKAFVRRGHAAALLTGLTSREDRVRMFGELGAGRLIVITCDVLSEGWDLPKVKCAILARPTRSLALYRQQVGRIMRASGRLKPVVLDHAGNALVHGLPHRTLEWSLESEMKKRGGAPPVEILRDGRLAERDPVLIAGRLVPADEADRLLACAVDGCNRLATRRSVIHVRSRGGNAYCDSHVGGGRPEVRADCSADGCKNDATKISAWNVNARGGPAFCAVHAGGKRAPKPNYQCSWKGCSNEATKSASSMKRCKGGSGNAFCVDHRRGSLAAKAPLPCSVEGCKSSATDNSANNSRAKGIGAFCSRHAGGSVKKKPRTICCRIGCDKPSTKLSSSAWRLRKARPYCETHRPGNARPELRNIKVAFRRIRVDLKAR